MDLRNTESEANAIDYTQYDFPKEIWGISPTSEVLLKSLTFLPLVVFGVIANGILLHIILKNNNLKTPTNFLISNMAFANLLTLLICPPLFLVNDMFQFYKLGPIGCKVEGFLECALLITAILNLCAISYDRLTAIVLPLENRITMKKTKIAMIVIWVAGAVLASPLLIYRNYEERQWKNLLETYCAENNEILPIYWHVLIAVLVWMPLCVMIFCYSMIFWKLNRYEKSIRRRENPICVSYKRKFAKTMFIILISFVVLRVPFTALVFIRSEKLKDSQMNQIDEFFVMFWYISHYLIFVNCASDPIIYGVTNDNFRRAFRQSMWYTLCCCHKFKSLRIRGKKFRSKNKVYLQPKEPTLAIVTNSQVSMSKTLRKSDAGWINSDKMQGNYKERDSTNASKAQPTGMSNLPTESRCNIIEHI